MSATNHTTNYELPIFVGTDKPAWLVDWNGAMSAIDTALHQIEGKADQAGTDIGGIESAITTINGTLTSINNAVSQIRIDTSANTGSINTITSLIGNGLPTTQDKTIIGAINELDARDHGLYELWKNNNITTAFASQSVVISDFDPDEYDAIWIAFEPVLDEQYGAEVVEFDREVIPLVTGDTGLNWINMSLGGKITKSIRSIAFTLGDDTLTISFGDTDYYVFDSYATAATATTNNSQIIPVRILGLRHNN